MHTIASLRKTLDLSTTNQVRNRIDAIKDLLADCLRRGPNNQILISDEGAELLRQLQDLYDSGLTMTEASSVLKAKTYEKGGTAMSGSSGLVSRDTKPDETQGTLRALRQEIATLQRHVAQLEDRLRSSAGAVPQQGSRAWWASLQEDLDGS